MTIKELITELNKVEDKEQTAELYTNPEAFQKLEVEHLLDGTAYLVVEHQACDHDKEYYKHSTPCGKCGNKLP
jgi:hypothetical protein